MVPLIIREVQDIDIEEIADLCNQLGYQTESEDIPLRLKQISDLDHHIVFVAELDNLVIGWIHVYICPLMVSPFQAQLGGLVVHSKHRGKGIGTRLMHQAEAWSKSHGCKYLTIFTNITRIETHIFYDHIGYQNIKTEHVMRKEI